MRKGQFFIIGAVLIIVILYGINSVINQNIGIDYSQVQGNDDIWIFEEVIDKLNGTIQNSDDIENDLIFLIELEKDSLINGGKLLDVDYEIKEDEVWVNVTLKSQNQYLEKRNIIMKR